MSPMVREGTMPKSSVRPERQRQPQRERRRVESAHEALQRRWDIEKLAAWKKHTLKSITTVRHGSPVGQGATNSPSGTSR